jgi:transposase-like protein
MSRMKFSAEHIISKLRQAEVLQSKGQSIVEICRQIEVKEQTYYKWRKEYGGMRINQAKRLKEVEQENTRLKKLVADLSLDNAILKETVRGNY